MSLQYWFKFKAFFHHMHAFIQICDAVKILIRGMALWTWHVIGNEEKLHRKKNMKTGGKYRNLNRNRMPLVLLLFKMFTVPIPATIDRYFVWFVRLPVKLSKLGKWNVEILMETKKILH